MNHMNQTKTWLQLIEAEWSIYASVNLPSLVQIIACRLVGAKHWTSAGIFLKWPLGTKFSEISMEIHISSFRKMYLKMSSAKCLPFCFGLNVLTKNEKHSHCVHNSWDVGYNHRCPGWKSNVKVTHKYFMTPVQIIHSQITSIRRNRWDRYMLINKI